jgi:DNA polymerase
MQRDERRELLGALRGYLEEMAETGVEGLPLDAAPTRTPVVTERTAVAAASPAAVPPVRESLEDIRADLGDCRRCGLAGGRTNLVYGVGNPRARLVFVGEGPGRDEDLQGEPFVGEAGKLLTKIIEAMGLQRGDVYICNVIKCRPPQNRDPLPPEVEACSSFMLRQVKAINPVVIVALGKFAAQTLLATKTPISRLRGSFHDFHGIPLMPTFHPAALLRDASLKRDVWEDMKQVMKLLADKAH